MSPAPEPYHQVLVLGLASQLRARLREAGRGDVYISPIDLHLAPGTLVQPDILALESSRRGIVGRKKVTGTPNVVVEVLSPSATARRRDRKTKMERYQRAGVEEYLIVDPATHTVEQYVLGEQGYSTPRRCTDRLELTTFPGIVLDLREIW